MKTEPESNYIIHAERINLHEEDDLGVLQNSLHSELEEGGRLHSFTPLIYVDADGDVNTRYFAVVLFDQDEGSDS